MKLKNFFVALGLCSLLATEEAKTQDPNLVIKGKTELENVILRDPRVRVDSFFIHYKEFPNDGIGEALFRTLTDSVSYSGLRFFMPKGPSSIRTLWGRFVPELDKDYSSISNENINYYRLNDNTYVLDDDKTIIQFWKELVESIPERPIVSAYGSETVSDIIRDVKVKDGKREIITCDINVEYKGFHNDYLLVKFSPADGGFLEGVYMYTTRNGKMVLFEIDMKFPLKDYIAYSLDYYRTFNRK